MVAAISSCSLTYDVTLRSSRLVGYLSVSRSQMHGLLKERPCTHICMCAYLVHGTCTTSTVTIHGFTGEVTKVFILYEGL